jgi:Fic family protein
MELLAMLKRIDETKKWIENRRPLAPEEVRQLDAYFRIGLTYSSNALEGNTLTLTETKVLLEDGLTIGGKPIRDCYEAIGHAKAYDFMLKVARSDPFVFSEDTILTLHKLFYQGIDAEKAGIYRDVQVIITGSEYVPPKAKEVPVLMKGLVDELNEKWNQIHPVRLAAFAHLKLVDIHPFVDGNGRTSRLLMNLILINRGYQIISIPPILRLDYINALEAARFGKNPSDKDFNMLMAECQIDAQKDFCRMFDIKPPQKDGFAR